jgi:hypothetical protein
MRMDGRSTSGGTVAWWREGSEVVFVRKRRPAVLIRRMVLVVKSRVHCDICPLVEVSTIGKARFSDHASNNRDAI